MAASDPDKLATLRRADLKTSLLLIALSFTMLITALGYPLEDSYGGVESTWYVSPALLPLGIAGALLLLSLILLGNALRYAVTSGRMAFYTDIAQFVPGQRGIRTLLIALFIGGYTWLLLPGVDFVVATTLFLTAFIGVFYGTQGRSAWVLATSYLVACIVLRITGLIIGGDTPGNGMTDWFGVFAIAGICWQLIKPAHSAIRMLNTVAISLGTALVVAVCFRFGLLVPLPHEGLVIDSMHNLRALLR